MKLSSPRLAWAGESEGEASDIVVARLESATSHLCELRATDRQNLLHQPLDRTRRGLQTLCDLAAAEPSRVQRGHIELSRRQVLDHDPRDRVDFRVLLSFEHRDVSASGRQHARVQVVERVIVDEFACAALAHPPEAVVSRRAQPRVDLTLDLAPARVLGPSASFLEGILDLVLGGAGVPCNDLPAELQRGIAAGDPLQQRPRRLPARPVSHRNTHALRRAWSEEVGPPLERDRLMDDTRPVDRLNTHGVESPALKVPRRGPPVGSGSSLQPRSR